MIYRSPYLELVKPFIDKSIVKVIIGVRRSGKTVLLNQVQDYILQRCTDRKQIINLNFESFSNKNLRNADNLYAYVLQKCNELKGKRIYLFFDEIQEVKSWQKVINSFLVDIDCDIYLTGSNSNMLSGELATYIAGRYIHINVYPFTFSESLQFCKELNLPITKEELFEDYLIRGGLPQRFTFNGETPVKMYLDDVFNTIVIKDIVERNKIKDVDLLKRIILFILDNIGNTFSGNSICNKLKEEGVNTTVTTVMNYIAAIKSAMIIVTAQRYDIKGKSLLSTSEKYFATDLGIRNHIKSSDIIDYSKLYENIVFVEMLSRGYEITVGKFGEKEIDFICQKGKEKIYIQVAYLLADSATIEREFSPLRKIDDNYPKYVISGDKHDFSGYGIIHKNIIEFLLDK